MEQQKIFRRGIPTEPDVKALENSFPVSELKPGILITYREVSNVIECHHKSGRFKTVTNFWRIRLERDHGIIMGCRAGEGFIILDDRAKLKLSSDKLAYAARSTRRSIQISGRIDMKNLDESQRRQLGLMERRSAAIMGIVSGKRDLELPRI